ncbi:MAG: hypothetical protein DME55_04490 [Verrucomicrobia bacterium]|nr:MAG: hypothetical protein DME55_04490 [Verrucomicrobiota bacterium]
MKTRKPAVIALVLWLLFVASNAFAVFKSPYPLKAYPPDQTTVIASGHGDVADRDADYGLGNASHGK